MQTRDTSRAVLLNPRNEMLLIKIFGGDIQDPRKPIREPFWITPGGRIEQNESPEEAVLREIYEETGLQDLELGPLVWYGEQTLLWRDKPTLLREKFFIIRTKTCDLNVSGMNSDESAAYRGHRWWTTDELVRTKELTIPRNLGYLLLNLLRSSKAEFQVIDLSTPQ